MSSVSGPLLLCVKIFFQSKNKLLLFFLLEGSLWDKVQGIYSEQITQQDEIYKYIYKYRPFIYLLQTIKAPVKDFRFIQLLSET